MKKRTKILITCLWLGLAGTGAALSSLAGMFLYLSPNLPSVASIKEVKLETPLRIYSADKQLIGEIGEHRRSPLTIDQIPKDLINAIIATEDEDFYEHSGVSIKGIARAVVQIIKTGRKGSGGSTITMQITRHVFLHLRQEFTRKFNEIILARKIEQELSKDEILELYCNYMFLGKRAYGVEAAAQVYYGKSLQELDLPQLAMIAGVFQGPSAKNPIANPEKAVERRNHVLGRMLKVGFIDQNQYEEAVSQADTASQHGKSLDMSAPYITEIARAKAVELYGQDAYKDGYEIFTTVDSELQQKAQTAVVDGILAYDERHGYRGPEMHLDVALLETPPEGEDTNSDSDPENLDYSPWIAQLETVPVYADLLPAAVITVSEDKIGFLLADKQMIEIPWEGNLNQIRLYVNENVRNPGPKSAADLLQVGDVVRLKRTAANDDNNEIWHLSQIPAVQGSLVALSPENGAILALVGGFDFHQSNFNRVTQAERQPGSNFKPFIYTTALESGMTPATVINDAPIVFEYDEQLETDWRPTNDNETFAGPTRLRRALAGSKNLVSIRVLRAIGVNNAVKNMGKFGFDESTIPKDLSLALGSLSVTPLKLVSGYAVFANGGYRVEPWLIKQINNIDGHVVYAEAPATVCRECELAEEQSVLIAEDTSNDGSNPLEDPASETEAQSEQTSVETNLEAPMAEAAESPYEFAGDPFDLPFVSKYWLGIVEKEDYPKAEKVLDERTAYIIDSMLRDVVRLGTATRAKQLGRFDLAGKTGTTNGPNDVWFSGYNGDVVATAWIGFDQHAPLGNREYGGTAALPIWMDFMEVALAGKPETVRAQPPGIVSVKINPETGERAQVNDPDAIFEIFRSENVPELKEGGNNMGSPWDNEEVLTEDLF